MDLADSQEDAAFRTEVREWLADNLTGEFAEARGLGGSGSEHEAYEIRTKWNQHLAAHGWTCLDWPKAYGGQEMPLYRQVIFHEEYARSNAPIGVNHIGETLVGPTVIAFGTDEQKERFLPGIRNVTDLWCQGYSEPNAGSDLAAVRTKAELVDGKWHINGQKVWTSLALQSNWVFLVVRTEPGSQRHQGLSYLLCEMDQPGIKTVPINQITGTSEFNEVFFDDAVTDEHNAIGGVGNGWKVAMATLGFERGVSTLAEQIHFRHELDTVIDVAKANGTYQDPVIGDRIARMAMDLDIMRLHALRTLTGVAQGTPGPEASTSKLHWANWHRALGELAMAVQGAGSMLRATDVDHSGEAEGTDVKPGYDLTAFQRLFLFSRSDTIYGGSNEIQRNIIAERVLGLPREPKGA